MKSCGKINLPFIFGGASANQFVEALEMPDNRIYLGPYSATCGRYIDLETMTMNIPKWEFAGGAAKHSSLELLDNGKVFHTPYCNTFASLIDPANEVLEPERVGTFPGNYAYNRHIKLPDGRLYLIPHNALFGQYYDQYTNTFSAAAGTFPGNYAYAGGVYIGNGKSFLCPAMATKGAIVDHVNNSVSFTNCNFPGGEAFVTCLLIDPNTIFLAPHKSSFAMLYHISTDTCTVITPVGGANYGTSGVANYIGAVEMDDKRIYHPPFQATRAKITDLVNNTLKDAPGEYASGGMFRGATKLRSGRILPAPFNTDFGVIVCS